MSGDYTRGPWRVDEFDGWLFISAPIKGSELRSKVAQMAGPSIAADTIANATLAAEAPALLKACADWLAYIDAPAEQGDGKHEEWLFAQMRAAVTRATGEAQP